MKTGTIDRMRILALLLAAGLAACAPMRQDQDHQRHHRGQQSAGREMGAGMTGGAAAGMTGSMGPMDKEAMCARYRGMRDAPDEQARQAMMHKEMGAMSPEMRQRHMEMMRKQCQ
ncbi:hypothetical protein [Massilia sp. Mn16-1_5]|uniref:hypothetical protein n=1 Tax=Massilia sp. Mn16-1_5 TaxID=2079199 RepID=UPI00109EAA20|nr:hypothetical protein [Massilia sp. Mn16-1_5]